MSDDLTLSQVADCLELAVRIGSLFRLNAGFVPTENSPAARDAADPTFGALAAEVPVYAGMILAVVDDHLEALGRVIRTTPPVWANDTLQRVVLEGCAVVGWLLEPNLSPEERASRGLSERARSLQERIKTLETVAAPARIVSQQEARLDGILKLAANFEWNIHRRKRSGDVIAINSSRPHISRMIRNLFLDDGDIGKLAVGMYRMNSSIVHAALGSVAEKVNANSPSHGELYGITHPTVTDIAGVISIALMAWGRGNFQLIRHCGWNENDWRARTQPIGGFIKRLMVVKKTP